MPDLPKNQTYNADAFQQLAGEAFNLAGTLPEKKEQPSKKSRDVDLDKFNNVRDVAKQSSPEGQQTSSASNKSIQPSSLGPVTVPYGGQTKFEKPHPGVDVAMETGQEVPAFTGGVVEDVRTGQEQTPNTPSFGNYVVIRDEQGNKHRYSHLHNTWVQEGQEVSSGETIGGAGHSGGAYSPSGGSGTHLDYRIKNAYDKYVNPNKVLGK